MVTSEVHTTLEGKMRKTFFIVITIFIILFLNTSCISKDAEYYPLGDIGSNNMDSSALEHYREELMNSGLFESNHYLEFRVTPSVERNVKLYEMDATGNILKVYTVIGDMCVDIIRSTNNMSDYIFPDFSFEYAISIDSNGNVVGNRILRDVEVFSDSSVQNFKEKFLVEKGYPDCNFRYDYNENKLYYGDWIIEGDAAYTIEARLYGCDSLFGNEYSINFNRDIIYTKNLDV